MTLHYQDINSLSAADIQRLVDDQVPEGRDLDYKEQLPKDSEDERREFRFDVSSFANTGGGIILYGIKEKKGPDGNSGIPEKVVPLSVNPDKETLRLEQVLRSHVDLRIPGVQVRFLEVENGMLELCEFPRAGWACISSSTMTPIASIPGLQRESTFSMSQRYERDL